MTATKRQLLARCRRGEALTWDEMLQICPHRAILQEHGAALLGEADTPAFNGACAVIGDHPGAFSEGMRVELVEKLRDGEIVLLLSNEMALLDYALQQIALDIEPPAGNA